MASYLMLAEEAAQNDPGGSFISILILFGPPILLLFVMQTIWGRTDAKDKAKRDQLIAGLRKNDSIVTIGGIMGTVALISEDKKTVTIKVDENTRLKMQAAAIREVLTRNE